MSNPNGNSWNTNFYSADQSRIIIESSERTFEEKGLFIIPYDASRIVATLKVTFKVVFIEPEYRSLWTNPELGFYGYAHARRNKVPYGSPIPLNLREQEIFYWNCPEHYTQLETIGTIVNLARLIGTSFEFGRLYFPAPVISDFSFGFKVAGRYTVKIDIGYWLESTWPDLGFTAPIQDLPNPDLTEGTDPTPGRQLGDPNAPLSPVYDPTTNDFGESDGDAPDPEPENPMPASPFRFVWNASGPGFDFVGALTFEYSGPQITNYDPIPYLNNSNQYVLRLYYSGGTFELFVGRGLFVTPEQNAAFLNTFTITGTTAP